MIPKKIHYCWFGENPLPKTVLKCIISWKKHLPDYELTLWNESNSPMNITYIKQAYKEKKYAFVSDYVRLWAINKYGGIYLDTDMLVIDSFNTLLYNNIFFGYEDSNKNKINAAIFGAQKSDNFIQEILKAYDLLTFESGNMSNLIIPKIITKIYEKSKFKEDIKLYPFDYFYPFPYENRLEKIDPLSFKTKNTLAIHLWDKSWYSKKDVFFYKYNYYKKIIIKLFSYRFL